MDITESAKKKQCWEEDDLGASKTALKYFERYKHFERNLKKKNR